MTSLSAVNWPAAAERLGALIPPEQLHPAVLRWASGRGKRETWGVACSGGPDSLALLLLVWAHWPERRRRLVALHFDHRLRGRASRADAAFCRKIAAKLGVRFIGGKWPGRHRDVSEAEARAARLEFFAGQRAAKILWLGHQQDDIAESMLMRLARGSGSGGLAAPRPIQRMPHDRLHVRPLLALKKCEIIAALRAAGIPWREDATNAGRAFLRNRIRADVIPAWQAAAERDALAGAARTRELLEEDDAALEAWVDDLAPLNARGELSISALAGKPRALVRRALHRWAGRQRAIGDLSRQAFEALLGAVQLGRPTRQSVGLDGFAVIQGGILRHESAGKRRRKFQRSSN